MKLLYLIPFIVYAALYAFIYKIAFMSIFDTNVIMLGVMVATSIIVLTVIKIIEGTRKSPDTNVYQEHTESTQDTQPTPVEPDELDYESAMNYNGR